MEGGFGVIEPPAEDFAFPGQQYLSDGNSRFGFYLLHVKGLHIAQAGNGLERLYFAVACSFSVYGIRPNVVVGGIFQGCYRNGEVAFSFAGFDGIVLRIGVLFCFFPLETPCGHGCAVFLYNLAGDGNGSGGNRFDINGVSNNNRHFRADHAVPDNRIFRTTARQQAGRQHGKEQVYMFHPLHS
ncbi:hypothetical protein Barb7_00646 [Bacteroidales bacterium Barb7]|nr:hypothetical protein Barb7_00646 [Bacteroidales bacterium Barb7]